MEALHFSSGNFKAEVLDNEKPVLVDFHSLGCAPCRLFTPTVDQVAADFAGRVKVGKLDVDESADIAKQYGVNSLPTIIVFKGGQIAAKNVGALPKPQVAEMLEKVLK
jgi:thioredoxin 1